MEIIQFHSFYEIVKTGSFSKASMNVFRSQSAVSHQIKKLEEELNVKLFKRLGTKVKLTEEGEILLDLVSSFFNQLETVKRRLEDMKQCKYGNLTIATTSGMMTYVLPDVIERFVNQFPGIKFKLVSYTLISEIQSMVLNGDADIGIGPRSKQFLPQHLNFLFWKCFDRVLLTAKDHPLCRKKGLTSLDISKYPIISLKKGTLIREDLAKAFVCSNVPYEIVMEVDVTENIKKFVGMGIGISILPMFALSQEDKNQFYFINVNRLFGKTDYGIYYRKDRYVTTSMKQFIKSFVPELYEKLLLE